MFAFCLETMETKGVSSTSRLDARDTHEVSFQLHMKYGRSLLHQLVTLYAEEPIANHLTDRVTLIYALSKIILQGY